MNRTTANPFADPQDRYAESTVFGASPNPFADPKGQPARSDKVQPDNAKNEDEYQGRTSWESIPSVISGYASSWSTKVGHTEPSTPPSEYTFSSRTSIETKCAPYTPNLKKKDEEIEWPVITDFKDPARHLTLWELRLQRFAFCFVILGINIAVALVAIFSRPGLFVLVFMVFVKAKDVLSVLIIVFGKLFGFFRRHFRPKPPVDRKWILSLIPTYSESEEQIIKAIKALRHNDVDPHMQVMCVILDGKHRDILSHMTRVVKTWTRPYLTTKSQHITLRLVAGFIDDVPILVAEKLQNAGKKDSLVLCHDLFNSPRADMPVWTQYLRDEIWRDILPELTAGYDFKGFDMVFCTDADSTVCQGAVARLANALSQDPDAIAACGLVLVELEPGYEWSIWNLYQQYQYTYGQFVRRMAEGMIGKVTCLPGCITMIAVRPEMAGAITKYAAPVTGLPVIHHQVQYLGTDRRLTYSMLSQSKKMRTIFVPDAVSETVAPQSLLHYLSQRRRWGSNAYFNNYFYCFGQNMWLITRIAAAMELVRMTMIYYRVVNTVLFIKGLVEIFHIFDILPLLIVTQLPLLWFVFSMIFLEHELRIRAHKLFLGFFLNKIFSPFISIAVFTRVIKNLGSQVWGVSGVTSSQSATASEEDLEAQKTKIG